MNYKMMGRFLGQILFIEALLMIPALGISLFCGDSMAVRGFLVAIAVAAASAAVLYLIWVIIEKLIWGSDVPGTLNRATYPQMMEMFRRAGLTEGELEGLFYANALRAYDLRGKDIL